MLIDRLQKDEKDQYCKIAKCGNEIFLGAQTGYDLQGGFNKEGSVETQTAQACENILTLLKTAGADVKALRKISIYVAEQKDSKAAIKVVAEKFKEAKPAMSCFTVDLEEEKMLVKLDAEAYIE